MPRTIQRDPVTRKLKRSATGKVLRNNADGTAAPCCCGEGDPCECEAAISNLSIGSLSQVTGGTDPAWATDCTSCAFSLQPAPSTNWLWRSTAAELWPPCVGETTDELENMDSRVYVVMPEGLTPDTPFSCTCRWAATIGVFFHVCYRRRASSEDPWEYGCCTCFTVYSLSLCAFYDDVADETTYTVEAVEQPGGCEGGAFNLSLWDQWVTPGPIAGFSPRAITGGTFYVAGDDSTHNVTFNLGLC